MLHVEMKIVLLFIAILAAAVAGYNYTIVIFTGGTGKNGSTVAVSFTHSCFQA